MTAVPGVIAVVGPTSSGKSDLADYLAREFDGEIISADSMQIYKGMDIGTAKIPVSCRSVPYHLLDILEPGEPYSAALFQRDARVHIDRLLRMRKTPILCGGTGLYIRAALDNFEFPKGEQENNPVREKYEQYAREFGEEKLYDLLSSVDFASAALIHPHNVRRVIRALEMHDEGESYAKQHEGFDERVSIYPTCFLGLSVEPEILNERINKRVDAMIDCGLLDEIKKLMGLGFTEALTASQAIGYKEFVPVLSGEDTLENAISACKQATRRYGKRQRTWFRADKRIQWLDANEGFTQKLCDSAVSTIKECFSGQ